MKKIVIVTLIIAGLIFVSPLFAGGKKEQPEPSGGGTEEEMEPMEEAMPYEGMTLRLACMSDQFAPYLKALGEKWEDVSGAVVEVDILGYTELYQKLSQDYATDTKLYDLATTDIVWSGEFAVKGWTMDLTSWIDRDRSEINYNDIFPVMWTMGSWGDKQIAFPMAGYGNSLIYRKDLFTDSEEMAAFEAEYGYKLAPPDNFEQMADIAEFFTRKDENLFGLVANGARGPAVAQDWMEYMRGFGGQIVDNQGNVEVDSQACVESLQFFVDIFDKWAPPGAIGYWWDDRETAYRTGQAVMQSSWSIARAGYEDETISMVAGKTDMAATPLKKGVDEALYGVGGWGIGINADVDAKNKEAAWEFIKWITSPEIQKEWLFNDGAPIRKSTCTDPEVVEEMPWMPTMYEIFDNGDGDYRPRVPEYTQIQDILGLRVNQAITHELTVEEAIAAAAEEIREIYE